MTVAARATATAAAPAVTRLPARARSRAAPTPKGAARQPRSRTTVVCAAGGHGGDLSTPARDGTAAADSLASRRGVLVSGGVGLAVSLVAEVGAAGAAEKQVFTDFRKFSEFTETPSGLQYRDVRIGEGTPAEVGKKVVVDWAGYTIHLGRIVEAKLLTKGGAFGGDEGNLLRFTLGDGSVIPAFEEAIAGMNGGGIRRILVPPGPLSYPFEKDGTQSSKRVGPRPSTFSGQRALDFVLKNNGNIDKSLLFDIELLEISPAGAARRGPGYVVGQAGAAAGGSASVDWNDNRGTRLTNGLYDK